MLVDPSLSTVVVAFIALVIFFDNMVRLLHTRSGCCGSNNGRSRFCIGAIICVRQVARHVTIWIAARITRVTIELIWRYRWYF